MSTDVSKEHVASIIRVEEYARQKLRVKQVSSRYLLDTSGRLTFN
jgi:hypothetical protein